jgi:hypothetical protein
VLALAQIDGHLLEIELVHPTVNRWIAIRERNALEWIRWGGRYVPAEDD